jgi:hypothetical protein
MSPLFLHTGWRTAGTWIWSRFRQLPQARTFYEPFNAVLASGRETLLDARADNWDSGHPALEQPYYSEYLPLLRAGQSGVEHFDASFELDRFAPLDAAASAAQRRYLDGLLDAARRDGRVAVLKFCRSMGRLPWMLAHYPDARHVAVVRNPAAQWASAWQQVQRSGNTWFVYAPYRVLAGNLDQPRVARLLRALDCDLTPDWATLTHAQAEPRLRARPALVHYRVFLALWLLNMMSISDGLDALIDSDLLGLSTRYGQWCAAHLRASCGLDVDFADAHATPISATPRDPVAWLGFGAHDALYWHAVADHVAQVELGENPSAALARHAIRSKLALANQQVPLGGLAWQALPEQIEEPLRFCTDLLAFQSLHDGERAHAQPDRPQVQKPLSSNTPMPAHQPRSAASMASSRRAGRS